MCVKDLKGERRGRKDESFESLNSKFQMRWKFAVEMAAGLNYIHTRRPPIVHRDLKVPVFFLIE
jgi:hypothetical protein